MKTASAVRSGKKVPQGKTERVEQVRTQTPIATILAPVDFSRASAKALGYAAQLAKQYNAKTIPMFVVDLPEVVGMFQLLLDDDEMKAMYQDKLQKFARKAGVDRALIDHVLVRKGRPHREITDAATTLKADIIVISTHGYCGVERAFLGSVTERVVREAPCPVLVVRENEREIDFTAT